jgi:hypothetical protein
MSLIKKIPETKHAIFIAVSGCFFATAANAADTLAPTLVWLKPLESDLVMQGNTIVKGDALNLLAFVANHIDEVEHRFEAYPIRRSWRLIQNNLDQQLAHCFWGANYIKEREDWGYFTEPTTVELPYIVAAKKDHLDAFETDGKVSVTQLLKKGYSTVVFEEVSNPLTEIIRQTDQLEVIKVSGLDKDLSAHTLMMIEKGRINFGYVSYRAIASLAVDKNPHFSLYEVQELSSENLKDGRILCSKNEFGKKMVASIYTALLTIRNDENLRTTFKALTFKAEGYPANLKQTFGQQWDSAYLNKTRNNK